MQKQALSKREIAKRNRERLRNHTLHKIKASREEQEEGWRVPEWLIRRRRILQVVGLLIVFVTFISTMNLEKIDEITYFGVGVVPMHMGLIALGGFMLLTGLILQKCRD